jgi:hypothetical protein
VPQSALLHNDEVTQPISSTMAFHGEWSDFPLDRKPDILSNQKLNPRRAKMLSVLQHATKLNDSSIISRGCRDTQVFFHV